MKKYLLSLLLVCVGFISFCSAGSSFSNGPSVQYQLPMTFQNQGGFCFMPEAGSSMYKVYTDSSMSELVFNGFTMNYLYCTTLDSLYITYATPSKLVYIKFFTGINNLGGSSSCDPQYTSEECQSVYSLVPSSDLSSCNSSLSSCNSNLSGCNLNLSGCMTNLDNYSSSLNNCSSNLNNCNTSLSSCMSSNCPVSSGNVSWSSLFINNIQHLGAPIIDITIPEEFDWDYVSTDEEFTLDIEGYNVDTEYMNGIITTQTTLPNDIDFNNIISSVIPLFIPGIVIIFFLYFIFRFIKKIF